MSEMAPPPVDGAGEQYGEIVLDRLSATGHPDLWVGMCLGCGGKVTRLRKGLIRTRRQGWTSQCKACQKELRRGIFGRRDLSRREKMFLYRWQVHGNLYWPDEVEREKEWLRERIGVLPVRPKNYDVEVVVLEGEGERDEPRDSSGATLEALGAEFKLSRERMRQLVTGALEQLRSVWPDTLTDMHEALLRLRSDQLDYEDSLIAAIDSQKPPTTFATLERWKRGGSKDPLPPVKYDAGLIDEALRKSALFGERDPRPMMKEARRAALEQAQEALTRPGLSSAAREDYMREVEWYTSDTKGMFASWMYRDWKAAQNREQARREAYAILSGVGHRPQKGTER